MNDIKFDELQKIGAIKNGKFEIENAQIKEKNEKGEKIPGVWALFGKTNPKKIELEGYGYPWDKPTDSEMWCLQVGQSQDIIGEITSDISLFTKPLPGKHEYVNQFGEHIFSYIGIGTADRSLGNIYSYYFLSEYFTGFKFVLLQETQNENLRKKIESMFAIGTKALCWRNGGSAKKGGGIDSKSIYDEMIALKEGEKHKDFKDIPDKTYNLLLQFIESYRNSGIRPFKWRVPDFDPPTFK